MQPETEVGTNIVLRLKLCKFSDKSFSHSIVKIQRVKPVGFDKIIAEKFFIFSQGNYQHDEPFLLRICALHRVPPEWDHDEYKVSLQIYHGTRPIVELLQTEHRSFLKEESGMGNDLCSVCRGSTIGRVPW